jgi:hypothetical protein
LDGDEYVSVPLTYSETGHVGDQVAVRHARGNDVRLEA